MRVILLDGFDIDFVKEVPFLLDLMQKSIFAIVRNFPNTDYLDIIEKSKQEIEFIHKKDIDMYAHYYPIKLKKGLENLNRKLNKICQGEFIILSDHGNQELSKEDKELTGLYYGHDYFPTNSPFFAVLKKQSPKDIGFISGQEARDFLKLILK